MLEVKVLMYHYVRPIQSQWSARHNILDLDQFRFQMEQIQKSHAVVASREISGLLNDIQAFNVAGRPLVWLTFDDGYKDCHEYVLPELVSRGLNASFLVPTLAISNRKLLDVNAIHLILSYCPNPKLIVEEIRSLWEKRSVRTIRGENFDAAYARIAIANLWNDKNTRFIKKILQRELDYISQKALIRYLLEKFVGSEPDAVAEELYLTFEELRELESAGMDIGSHGHDHLYLADQSYDVQRKEIEESLILLEQSGISFARNVFSYPFGSYNDHTISIVNDLGIQFGLTNDENSKAIISKDKTSRLKITRIDAMNFDEFF